MDNSWKMEIVKYVLKEHTEQFMCILFVSNAQMEWLQQVQVQHLYKTVVEVSIHWSSF